MLKWWFIDGWWSAVSKIDDNGDSLDWRSEWQIKVTNKGRFSVSHSSPERDTHKETFATFEEASNWCQELENTLHTQPAKEPTTSERQTATDKHATTTAVNADVAYGHADAEQPVAAIVQPANNQVGKTSSLVWYSQPPGCELVAFSSHFKNKKPALWTISNFGVFSYVVDFSDKSYTAVWDMILKKGRFDSIPAAQAFCQELEDLFAADFKGLAEAAAASDSVDLVLQAIRLAVQMYNGSMQNDGERIFNATNFENAMQRLANTACKLDNAMVDAILRNRDDIEKGNGFYYRFVGDKKKG